MLFYLYTFVYIHTKVKNGRLSHYQRWPSAPETPSGSYITNFFAFQGLHSCAPAFQILLSKVCATAFQFLLCVPPQTIFLHSCWLGYVSSKFAYLCPGILKISGTREHGNKKPGSRARLCKCNAM